MDQTTLQLIQEIERKLAERIARIEQRLGIGAQPPFMTARLELLPAPPQSLDFWECASCAPRYPSDAPLCGSCRHNEHVIAYLLEVRSALLAAGADQ